MPSLYIDREECIGDSLVKLNSNFTGLDTDISNLRTLINTLSTNMAQPPFTSTYTYTGNTITTTVKTGQTIVGAVSLVPVATNFGTSATYNGGTLTLLDGSTAKIVKQTQLYWNNYGGGGGNPAGTFVEPLTIPTGGVIFNTSLIVQFVGTGCTINIIYT